jgi:hypothetical protein
VNHAEFRLQAQFVNRGDEAADIVAEEMPRLTARVQQGTIATRGRADQARANRVGEGKREAMTPRDWFLVGVRLFGVWWILNGITELYSFISILAKWFTPATTAPAAYLMHTVIYLVVGWYLLHGAPSLTRPAFPPSDSPQEQEKPSDTGNAT